MSPTAHLWRTLWRALGSSRLAALLLGILLLASVLSSLFPHIPAEPSSQKAWLAAVALRYHDATDLLHALGLFAPYRAPWYLGLLGLLVVNLTVCTLRRLGPLWRSLTEPPPVTRPDTFYRRAVHRAEWLVASPAIAIEAYRSTLTRHRYRTTVKWDNVPGQADFYAERGRWAQVGSAASHVAGVLLILAVAARPVLSWKQADVVLLPRELHPVENRAGWAVRAGSLTIDRHSSGQPRGYHVPVTILVDGAPVVTQTVGINHPLTFRGIHFHLQGYGPAAHLTAPEGSYALALVGDLAQELSLPGAGITLRVAHAPQADLPEVQPAAAMLFVEAWKADGIQLGAGLVADGQEIEVAGTPIRFALDHYTTWQVSHDPTFGPAVGAASTMLAAMVFALGSPHRRLWLRLCDRQAQMVSVRCPGGEFDALVAELSQAVRISSDSQKTAEAELHG